jgi:predicted nucleic acid-binding protein
MTIVITDSGPILSLAVCKQFHLLSALYPDYYLPETVLKEVVMHLPNLVDDSQVIISELHPRSIPITDQVFYNSLAEYLDDGEKECITLAHELSAQYFLVEDAAAKRIAKSMGFLCFGTIALFVEAKEKGLLNALRPCFVDLLRHGRYYSLGFLNETLKSLGESTL